MHWWLIPTGTIWWRNPNKLLVTHNKSPHYPSSMNRLLVARGRFRLVTNWNIFSDTPTQES